MNKLLLWGMALAVLASVFFWQRAEISSLESSLSQTQSDLEGVTEERDALATSLDDAESENKALMAEMKHLDAVMADREKKNNRIESKLEAALDEQRTEKKDDDYKDWSADRVPDSIIRMLNAVRHGKDASGGKDEIRESDDSREPSF